MVSRETYMNIALKEAEKGYQKGEIPVGVVIILDDKIIAKAHNTKEKTRSSIDHAEIIAINKAIKKIGDWRLSECEMYITLEPCIMCFGAIIQSRIKKIYVGTYNNSNDSDFRDYINRKLDITYGICREKSQKLMMDFFKERRK